MDSVRTQDVSLSDRDKDKDGTRVVKTTKLLPYEAKSMFFKYSIGVDKISVVV